MGNLSEDEMKALQTKIATLRADPLTAPMVKAIEGRDRVVVRGGPDALSQESFNQFFDELWGDVVRALDALRAAAQR